MKWMPIPFKAEMVRAVLGGTKTQTRRVMKTQPPDDCSALFTGWYHPTVVDRRGEEQPGKQTYGAWTGDGEWSARSPYGEPRDRLWVREAWRTVVEADQHAPRDLTPAHRIWLEADAPHQPGAGRYRPPMFMPRWASRIALEVTGVRVERLQDISEADAKAEGIVPHVRGGWHWHPHNPADLDDWHQFGFKTAALAYESLWNEINGADAWAANPWVWVVEFRRLP